MAAKHPNFKVHYIIDRAPATGMWKGSEGHVTAELLGKHLPSPLEETNTVILVCGYVQGLAWVARALALLDVSTPGSQSSRCRLCC
jgi:NAD(P)H-flavin reductase